MQHVDGGLLRCPCWLPPAFSLAHPILHEPVLRARQQVVRVRMPSQAVDGAAMGREDALPVAAARIEVPQHQRTIGGSRGNHLFSDCWEGKMLAKVRSSNEERQLGMERVCDGVCWCVMVCDGVCV